MLVFGLVYLQHIMSVCKSHHLNVTHSTDIPQKAHKFFISKIYLQDWQLLSFIFRAITSYHAKNPTGTGPGKIYIQMSHPSEGVISPTLSESLRFDPAQLDSRDLMNVLDPWTHSKAAKKFKGSKTLGGKRQAQPLLQHSSWMGARKFCEEQKVVPTVEPRAMSGGYLVGNFLKRKSKKSSILTKIEAFTR